MQVLTARDVTGADEVRVQDAVRSAFRALADGTAVQPPQTLVLLPSGGDVITYTGVLPVSDDSPSLLAVKVSPYLPQPTGPALVTAWTLLLSLDSGEPVLLVDSKQLTAERT